MFVGVYEVPLTDSTAEDLYLAAPSHRHTVCVTNAHPSRDCFEARVAHFIDVPYGTVRDSADAPQRFVCVGIDFSPKRADTIGFIQILNYNDFGPCTPATYSR